MIFERAAARIRKATPDDAHSCAQLLLMASHGMAEAVYRDLIPGQPTVKIIGDHRIRPEGRSSSYPNWWIAEDPHRNVAGAINAYPLDGSCRPMREELLTEDRIKILVPMIELDAEAAGTFFINIVAVFPEHRHGGIARRLIALVVEEARNAGMAAVSLTTFEDDSRLIAYYRGFGFTVAASRPIVPNECLLSTGNLVLMTMPVKHPD